MQDPTKHNYYKKLIQMFQQGKLPTASVSDVDIAHDDWCAIYSGGYCDCDPDIRIRPNLDPRNN
jgi:hypothetical protein